MEEVSFEENIEQLEKIVAELEKGDLNLEDSMKKFEQGIAISQNCNKILETVEKRITILLNEDGEIKEEDFSVKT